jgi:outer membrane murein-binding lipoprotein Lpp
MTKRFLLLIAALFALITTACSKQNVEANIVTEAAGVDWTEAELQKVSTKVTSLEARTAQLQKEVNALLTREGNTAPPPSDELIFKDVTTKYWAFSEIMYLYKSNLISGYLDVQMFKPEGSITRAQAAAMLVKSLKIPISDKPSLYSDVPDEMWARKAIVTVSEKGYFKGSNGKFMPNEPMTRKHMAVVLQRAFDLKSSSLSYEEYLDVSTSNDAYAAIKAVSQSGIAMGSNGRFMPADPTKRSQFSVFLYRALKK